MRNHSNLSELQRVKTGLNICGFDTCRALYRLAEARLGSECKQNKTHIVEL